MTTWCVDAPINDVFAALDDAASWPQWWPAVRSAELAEDGDEDGVGRLWRFVFRGRLPYQLAFQTRVVQVDRPWGLEGHATGDLIGVGRWRLYEGRGTAAIYEWNVRTSRPWMDLLAPVARPAFAWNHGSVMREGAEGLAAWLRAPLTLRSS